MRPFCALPPKLFAFTLIVFSCAVAQETAKYGSIKGNVADIDTKAPIIGANVIVVGADKGAPSDIYGNFQITGVPVGEYVLALSCIGYEAVRIADIVVKPDRVTFVRGELKMTGIAGQDITVTAGYFPQADETPSSLIGFTSEEIRRSAGAAGDVSRIIGTLPAIAKVNDQYNNLIVRGGSPTENAFYVDNVEIPNINHFPTQGSSAGALGLLNVDLIDNVKFSAGGFPATYGGKLSSVMELTLRDGDRDRVETQSDLSMAGVGVVAEGPIFGGKGSWLFSGRRSYVDWLVDIMGLGVSPWYGDMQAKLTVDLDPANRIVLLDIFGIDHNSPTKKEAEDFDFSVYGEERYIQNTIGLSWRRLWSKNAYSQTSVSHNAIDYFQDFTEASTDRPFINNKSLEQNIALRNFNHIRLNRAQSLEPGFEIKYLGHKYDSFYREYTGVLGDTTPPLALDDNIKSLKFGIFINYLIEPFPRLNITFGLRGDYFSYSGNSHVSPRLALSYKLNG